MPCSTLPTDSRKSRHLINHTTSLTEEGDFETMSVYTSFQITEKVSWL